MKPLLLHLRLAHQHSIAALAQCLNVTEQQYGALEAGESTVTTDQLLALSEFYQIDLTTIHHNEQSNNNIGTRSRGIFNVANYYENYTVIKTQTDSS